MKRSLWLVCILLTAFNSLSLSFAEIYHPREQGFSLFDKFYEEREKVDNEFIIVHINNSKLEEVLWASKNANKTNLKKGAHLDSFLDKKNSFPIGNYKDLIAILYSNGYEKYIRRDDGHDSDSFTYDDRIILKNGLYYSIYANEVFQGAQTGITKSMVKKIINGELVNQPRAIRCSTFFGQDAELPPILFKDKKLTLPSSYLGNEEEVHASFDENKIILRYKMKGEAPDESYYQLPDMGDISYQNGFYVGVIYISYDSRLFKDIKFPHNQLFLENYSASARFKKAFTSSYYAFLNPRVCSVEREIIE